MLARAEGIIPAPESAHAILAAMNEARQAKEEGTARAILFNLSGHGHFDMASFARYLGGELEDYEYPADKVSEALASVPKVEDL